MKFLIIPLLFALLNSISASANSCISPCGIAPNLKYIDPYTLSSSDNLLKHSPSKNASGNIQVVIEIPAGRTEKWYPKDLEILKKQKKSSSKHPNSLRRPYLINERHHPFT
jgi:hypothetical protein